MTKAVLGVIGGSGIYDLPGLQNVREQRIASPWGEPSAALRIGDIDGLPIVFLSRHDKGHRLSPTDINYRANIDVLKRVGVTDLISLSACGSFKEELPPGTFVLVDQFIDRTYHRPSSFFGTGCVAHVSMAHPVSPRLRLHLAEAADAEGIPVARSGTYVCIEGPQFSTLAESLTYKGLGYSVIGMTNLPEAKLAREAEICYATVAMVTDFDCWHPDHDAVTVTDIIKVLMANAEKGAKLVARLARDFPREHEPCPIGSDRALDTAIITAPEARDTELLKKLDAVAGRVLKRESGYGCAGGVGTSGMLRPIMLNTPPRIAVSTASNRMRMIIAGIEAMLHFTRIMTIRQNGTSMSRMVTRLEPSVIELPPPKIERLSTSQPLSVRL